MIQTEDFTKNISLLFAEIFGASDSPHGFVLDTGRSGLLGTIDALTAEVASATPRPDESTIASHCGHILFLLKTYDAYEQGQQPQMDWPASWAIRAVDEEAWATLRANLHAAYTIVVGHLQNRTDWPETPLAAALMLLAHCAYHVGEVRQRLLWVKL